MVNATTAPGRKARRLKDLAIRLCELALLATVVFSVVTAFDYIHGYVELFSHFRLQYFIASILLALVFVVLRWRSYALLGVATTLLNAWFVVPWFIPAGMLPGDDPPRAAEFGEPFTLLHANVHRTNDNFDRFIELVRDEQPELIIIQEATPDWLSSLARIDSSYPYKLTEARTDAFGIALYSKYPLDKTAIVGSEPRGYPDIVASALIGNTRLNLISTHPPPPIGNSNYGLRNIQLDAIAKLASRTPEPLIVIGDLNITMWASHYRQFEKTSGLHNARKGFGIKPTWPLFFIPAAIPIDHCLTSENIRVVNFRTGPPIGSDHLPILVSMSLAI